MRVEAVLNDSKFVREFRKCFTNCIWVLLSRRSLYYSPENWRGEPVCDIDIGPLHCQIISALPF